MTEELTVDRSLRDGSTVDSEIFLPTARRIIVDDTRDNLLTHTALTDDEHTEVGRRNLKGHVECMVQLIAVAHDVVPLLYPL